MDKVVHFEIPVDDAARAREFYASAFEWELNEADMGGGNMYTMVTTTPIDESHAAPHGARRHQWRPVPADRGHARTR